MHNLLPTADWLGPRTALSPPSSHTLYWKRSELASRTSVAKCIPVYRQEEDRAGREVMEQRVLKRSHHKRKQGRGFGYFQDHLQALLPPMLLTALITAMNTRQCIGC